MDEVGIKVGVGVGRGIEVEIGAGVAVAVGIAAGVGVGIGIAVGVDASPQAASASATASADATRIALMRESVVRGLIAWGSIRLSALERAYLFSDCASEGYGIGWNSHPRVELRFRKISITRQDFEIDYTPCKSASRYCIEPFRASAPIDAILEILQRRLCVSAFFSSEFSDAIIPITCPTPSAIDQ